MDMEFDRSMNHVARWIFLFAASALIGYELWFLIGTAVWYYYTKSRQGETIEGDDLNG